MHFSSTFSSLVEVLSWEDVRKLSHISSVSSSPPFQQFLPETREQISDSSVKTDTRVNMQVLFRDDSVEIAVREKLQTSFMMLLHGSVVWSSEPLYCYVIKAHNIKDSGNWSLLAVRADWLIDWLIDCQSFIQDILLVLNMLIHTRKL